MSSDLQWNIRIAESIKKANKRMYFFVLLKRAGVPDIQNFSVLVLGLCWSTVRKFFITLFRFT